MSDMMTPIPFGELMNWVLEEHKKGSVFGLKRAFKANPADAYTIFGRKLETLFGPAAGPHTQLTQNIVAAYYAGSRFFELKTVQIMDGAELQAAVNKPCILADDECYNCEWSTELYVPQAYEEYVKAWFILKVIAKEWGLGDPDGFQFNISVGYDLAGIKSPKIDKFINEMMDATGTPIFEECKSWLLANLDKFENITAEDVEAISPAVCNCATISTLHGCPPQEIESIATYLLTEKNIHTFIKCNPTLLGYETARKIMDDMGYDYVAFGDFHFKDDLQYVDAVPMLQRLQKLADEKNLEFGVKITNTFPVDVDANQLPSEEMYMSGKSLFMLSLSVAHKLSKDFDGKLRISFSGGADYYNIDAIAGAGIWPITMATTMLKPGGYQRLEQIANKLAANPVGEFKGIDVAAVEALLARGYEDKHHVKPIKPLPSRKMKETVPLLNCFVAPCKAGCPIHQDITSYVQLVGEGKLKEALEVILDKNPLPFITGTICAHNCMSKCTRNFYESPVNIRGTKLVAAEGGYDAVMAEMVKPEANGKKVAVVGGGPAGIAAAYFLARAGVAVTVYEKEAKLGGVVRNVIPGFRIADSAIDNDVAIIEALGVTIKTNTTVENIADLKKDYDAVVVTIGAAEHGVLKLEAGETINALSFLADFKANDGKVDLGKNVVVIGGGNTAMDTARAAKRTEGVEKVSLVYRRTKRYMPADAEELEMAIEDGVEFAELLAPIKLENGVLVCEKMVLGEADAAGRKGVVATGEMVEIPADTVIAATGEKVPTAYYKANGIECDERGRVIVRKDTMETSVDGVYVAGDGVYGPATVVEGIRDAQIAAAAIVGKAIVGDAEADITDEAIYAKKGILAESSEATESNRCLTCSVICENCVEACPNRANLSIIVPGASMHQVVHVDKMCNECGNCKSFCPYASAPYLDKFTVFATAEDMDDSKNQGFAVVDKATGACKVRLGAKIYDYTMGTKSADVPFGIADLIDTIIKDYSYIL